MPGLTQADTAAPHRHLSLRAHALRVHPVTALVEHREQRVVDGVLAHARSDTHITKRKLGHERVDCQVQTPALEVVAIRLHHLPPERELRGGGRVSL